MKRPADVAVESLQIGFYGLQERRIETTKLLGACNLRSFTIEQNNPRSVIKLAVG